MIDYAEKMLEIKKRLRKLDEALLHKKDPHRHLDALIVAADAGGQAVRAVVPAGAADLGKELSVDTAYQLTCTEATDAALGLKIAVWIKYVYV